MKSQTRDQAKRMNGSNQTPIDRFDVILFICCLIFACLLRIMAAGGDLWLDEVWSLLLARSAETIWGVFNQIPVDNNHILNTLYMLCVDKLFNTQAPFIVLRLFSLVSGIGAVVFAAMIANKLGRTQARLTVFFMSFSFFLIQYASEARGYSPAVAFSLGSFLSIDACITKKKAVYLGLYWLCTVAGLLSHLLFVNVLAVLYFWSLFRMKSSGRLRDILWQNMLYHTVPFLFLAGLYILFIRNIIIGGGPAVNIPLVVQQSMALSLGVFSGGLSMSLAPFFFTASFGAGLLFLAKKHNRPDLAVVFFCVVLLFPAIVLVLKKPQVLFPRYFLLGLPFFYIAAAAAVAEALRSVWLRSLACIFLVLFFVGNMANTALLIDLKRGGYSAALQYMDENSIGENIIISSDHDFRNGMLLSYYSQTLSLKNRISYISAKSVAKHTPDWIVLHRFGSGIKPPPVITPLGKKNPFVFKKLFPYAGLSGFHWIVYQHKSQGQPSPFEK